MAINDATGSLTHSDQNIKAIVDAANNSITSTIGSGGGGSGGWLAGLFGGTGVNFAGIASDRMGEFNAAIDSYDEGVQNIISTFFDGADVSIALKGDVKTAVEEFFSAMKVLLQNYVHAIEVEKQYLNEANANWLAGAQDIASSIGSDTGQIESDANSVRSQADGIQLG